MYPVAGSFANFFWYNEVLRLSISGAFPLALVLFVIEHSRSGLRVVKAEYLSQVLEEAKGIKGSIRYLIRMPEFQSELLAFACYALIFTCFIAIGNTAIIYAKVLAAIVMLVIFVFVYALIDGVLWLIVFLKWQKQK